MKLFSLFALASLFTLNAQASDCAVTMRDGSVQKHAIAIEWERGGPTAYGELKLAGLDITFESGYGTESEDGSGGKSVFQKFTVSRAGKPLAQQDLGESGQVFDASLEDASVKHIRCEL